MPNQVLYGFVNLKDVFSQRVEAVGVNVVNTAIDETLAEHNRQMAALTSLLVEQTTEYKVRYRTPGAARLQPLDEQGRARPIKAAGYYDIAFPLQDAGTAWGQTYKASKKMTVQEANNVLSALLVADKRWLADHILAALFASTAWTFPDPEHGDLTIKGLANGDTDSYLIQAGADTGATDTHYLAQANAIDNSNDPFGTLYSELMEHPENSGEVVAMISTGLKTAVQGLSAFYPQADPHLQPGVATTTVRGTLGVPLPGTLLGYHEERVWIAEWKRLPANYIVAVATGGPRPVAMREEEEASLRGFNRVAQRDDHPYYESQYLRTAGFGVQNRVGAVAMRIGNGAWAVPTNYSSPMP